VPISQNLFHISGVIPNLSVRAGHLPVRTESGIGALMPWADRLWFVSYVSSGPGSGVGTGLFSIDENFTLEKHPESVVGTYANRMIHSPSCQLIIGPYVIDSKGNVRTIKSIQEHRLTATMEHLEDPENKVYFLTMEGLLLEVDLNTFASKVLFDLNKELDLPKGSYPHYKGGYTAHNRVIVANNTYEEMEFLRKRASGRLAEWNGDEWKILEKDPFMEIVGRKNLGEPVFAIGWDKVSAILEVFINNKWIKYRLPQGSHAMDHSWLTEWWRIREVETERYLMDCHGIFYELPIIVYNERCWGISPICTHLRIIPDFCSWQGLLVLAGNQVTPIRDATLFAGQPQSGLWFGKTDDLWSWGKPKGWGGLWWDDPVTPDIPSEPFLMTGFDKKVVHICHNSNKTVEFMAEVDFLGDGTWKTYEIFSVPKDKYFHYEFPEGFSAHWIRFKADTQCNATVYLLYT